MSENSGIESIFPLPAGYVQVKSWEPGPVQYRIAEAVSTSGLTKRELFAAMAMQGIRSDPNGPGLAERIAEEAVQIADALLKELAK